MHAAQLVADWSRHHLLEVASHDGHCLLYPTEALGKDLVLLPLTDHGIESAVDRHRENREDGDGHEQLDQGEPLVAAVHVQTWATAAPPTSEGAPPAPVGGTAGGPGLPIKPVRDLTTSFGA